MCETGPSKLRVSRMPLSQLGGVLQQRRRFACAKHCTSAALLLVNTLNTPIGHTGYEQLCAVNFWRSSLRLQAHSPAFYELCLKSWCDFRIFLQNGMQASRQVPKPQHACLFFELTCPAVVGQLHLQQFVRPSRWQLTDGPAPLLCGSFEA